MDTQTTDTSIAAPSLYAVGVRIDTSHAPIKAERGVYEITSILPQPDGDDVVLASRVLATGKINRTAPAGASTSWYHRNLRSWRCSWIDRNAQIVPVVAWMRADGTNLWCFCVDCYRRLGYTDGAGVHATTNLITYRCCDSCGCSVLDLRLRANGRSYVVRLAATENPDRPHQKISTTPEQVTVHGALLDVSAVCRSWIERHGLGSGNWIGGQVYDHSSKLVAVISYNGRAWQPGPDGRSTSVEVPL